MLNKPTIFFSHSSRDSAVVARVKQLFVEKTHGTIDVFVSSDGQSIRLGKNWVHEIEQALERTLIMFVFLTPNSIDSGWIYFESGYCHSKGIEVIPVAFSGIDLNTVRPPLSLLQGFNLISAGSLNNLISTANLKFNTAHPESFVESDFLELAKLANPDGVLQNDVLSVVKGVEIYLRSRKDIPALSVAQFFRETLLNTDPLSGAQIAGRVVTFFGGHAEFLESTGGVPIEKSVSVTIVFNLGTLTSIEKAIQGIADLLIPNVGSLYLHLDFNFRLRNEPSHLSSLLRGTEATISTHPNGCFVEFGNLVFSVEQDASVFVMEFNDATQAPSAPDIFQILRVFLERGIIYKAGSHELAAPNA